MSSVYLFLILQRNRQDNLRTPVLIIAHITDSSISDVLFHNGYSPATERFEIAKIRLVIPVRVPQRHVAQLR